MSSFMQRMLIETIRTPQIRITDCGVTLLLGLLFCTQVGCSSKKNIYPVQGTVLYADDGQPVSGGVIVVFESTEPPHQRASSNVDVQGRFQLSTHRDNDGALAGKQRVRFTAPSTPTAPDPMVTVVRFVDPKFTDFSTSGIVVEVDPSADNDITIRVDKPPGGLKGNPAPLASTGHTPAEQSYSSKQPRTVERPTDRRQTTSQRPIAGAIPSVQSEEIPADVRTPSRPLDPPSIVSPDVDAQ